MEVKKCAVCQKSEGELQRCSRCKEVHYCSREHQVEDWKKGHNKACKALFIDRVDRAYDVGHVGLTHDGTRPIHMLTKDDVRDSAGGWWMLPSTSVTTDAEGINWVQEHFDTKNFNVKFFPWTDVLVCPLCEKECKEGVLAAQIMHRGMKDGQLSYIRPFPRIFHPACVDRIFVSHQKAYPHAQATAPQPIQAAWELIKPDVDELQAGLAQHDDQFRTTLDANKTKVAKDVGVM